MSGVLLFIKNILDDLVINSIEFVMDYKEEFIYYLIKGETVRYNNASISL